MIEYAEEKMEIQPHEYAALEREIAGSAIYAGKVLAQAVKIVQYKARMRSGQIKRALAVGNSTFSRITQGRPCTPSRAQGLMLQLAILLEGE